MNPTTDYLQIQFIAISLFFLAYILLTRQKISAFLYLISIPFLFYFPLNFPVLIFILLYGVSIYQLIFTRKKSFLLLTTAILIAAFLILKPNSPFFSPNINIIDHQRGLHPNYQTDIIAKLLHNKFFLSYQFLDNLVNHVSLSRFFASGLYPNFAKYVPIGYLFPIDLFLLFFAIKLLRQKLFNLPLTVFLSVNLLGIALYRGQLADFFLGSLVLFFALLVAYVLNRLPLKISLAIIVFNIFFLVFINPLTNLYWDVGFKL